MIDRFREIDCDYWCYTLSNGLPTIKTHFGFWGEGVSLEALEKVKSLTNNKSYIEHVTNYIYEHSNYFFVYKEKINKDIEDYKLRLTIDTKDDFELAKEIFDLLNRKGLDCSLENIINLVKTKPDWIHRMKNNIMENLK
jgi:spore coat polysaccharide biosynthesis protein SpsF